MSNQRNVDALTKLLADWAASDEPDGNEELAHWLASHGVLAPSALINGEVMAIWNTDPRYTPDHSGGTGDCRRMLERIARGDR